MTKSLKFKKNILFVIHLLLNIFPIAFYSVKGYIEADLVSERIGLSMTLVVVMILTVISWLNQINLRSKLWILLIGFYLCLDAIMVPLIIIACCQVIDELIVIPLRKHYKTKYQIHKEIDSRQ